MIALSWRRLESGEFNGLLDYGIRRNDSRGKFWSYTCALSLVEHRLLIRKDLFKGVDVVIGVILEIFE